MNTQIPEIIKDLERGIEFYEEQIIKDKGEITRYAKRIIDSEIDIKEKKETIKKLKRIKK